MSLQLYSQCLLTYCLKYGAQQQRRLSAKTHQRSHSTQLEMERKQLSWSTSFPPQSSRKICAGPPGRHQHCHQPCKRRSAQQHTLRQSSHLLRRAIKCLRCGGMGRMGEQGSRVPLLRQ